MYSRTSSALGYVLGWILAHTIMTPPRFRSVALAISALPFAVRFRYGFYRATLNTLGENVTVMQGAVIEAPNCEIGNNVYIGPGSVVYGSVAIEDGVRIAHHCTILSGGKQHMVRSINGFEIQDNPNATWVTIGAGAWIGCHAIVMASVGSGSIIGAGSVVTKTVSQRVVAVGNPASAKSRDTLQGGANKNS